MLLLLKDFYQKKIFSLCLAVFLVILQLNVANAKEDKASKVPSPSVNYLHITAIDFKGLTVLDANDFSEVLKPYINVTINDKVLAISNIKALVDIELIKAGYIFSSVTGHSLVGNKLILNVTEGSINEIVIRPELLEIAYLKEYIERLKANSPFDSNKAKTDIALIKRLLGSNVKIIPIKIEAKEVKNGKVVDLFIADHQKVNGIFDIDNSNKAFYGSNNTDTEAASIAQESGYFTLGSLYTRISNPYNLPSSLSTFLSSSGDRKENIIFTDYVHQINKYGTQAKIGAGTTQYRFYKKEKSYFTANIGISHPLILEEKHALELFAKTVYYSSDKNRVNHISKYKEPKEIEYDPINPINYNKNVTVKKLVLGPIYKFLSFFDTKHNYSLQWHKGNASQKFKNANSINKNSSSSFNKFEFAGSIDLPLPSNFELGVKVNAQQASKNLLQEEHFGAGGNDNGRGFLPNQISGYKGIGGTIELSHINFVQHPFLNGIRKYIYYDRAKANNIININSSNSTYEKYSLSSFGVGADFHLANDMVVKLGLNKPLHLKSIEEKPLNKKVKLFAGLEYYFAF